jgi:hypothetical protein
MSVSVVVRHHQDAAARVAHRTVVAIASFILSRGEIAAWSRLLRLWSQYKPMTGNLSTIWQAFLKLRQVIGVHGGVHRWHSVYQQKARTPPVSVQHPERLEPPLCILRRTGNDFGSRPPNVSRRLNRP